MAFGVKTPPLGEWIINLGEAAEYMFDHNIFQDNLVGVDFCEQMVKETNPGVLDKANKTEAPGAKWHGYKTIGDIMRALNPFTGDFYRETLQVSRYTREMFCLMEGRHVHPSTLYPGGVGTVPTVQLFTDYLVRLMRYVEFMKKCLPLHEDLFNFWYEALPGYEKVGQRRILLGCWGSFNNPDTCDYRYENMSKWGKDMFVTPGVIVDGKLVTQQSGRYQSRHSHSAGQFVLRRLARTKKCSSRRIRWEIPSTGGIRGIRPPLRARKNAISKASTPGSCRPAGSTSAPATTWRSIPAADPIARLWSTALSGLVDIGYVKATGNSVKIMLPKTALLPEVEFEWKIPQWSNAIERDRARTYFQAYAAACALVLRRASHRHSCTPATRKPGPNSKCPTKPSAAASTKRCAACFRTTSVIRNGKIANYHPYPPTPWNANPRDTYGTPGPYEDAVQNTPIFEENGPDNFKGIDIMRAVRSFDPCLPCGVHMYNGDGKLLRQVQHAPMFGVQTH